MQDLVAKRTLVKSPPELWSELSELERLAKHLDAFGEIRITKLEPEHTVAWEGDGASGTVSIEPAGWGTKVTLTAQVEEAVVEEPVIEEPVVEEPEPDPEPEIEEPELEVAVPEEPSPPPRRGFFARLFGLRQPIEVVEEVEVEELAVEEPSVEAPHEDAADPHAILDVVLDSLGAAHHRPFSRG
jgi:hypothetical protein